MDYPKTGYLNEDLRLFHLTDAGQREFRYHYHDFHKLLLPLSGNVSYLIEGKHYHLEPGDAVLVRAGELHRPLVHDDAPYERIIAYISPAWFDHCRAMGGDPSPIFEKRDGADLLRLEGRTAKTAARLRTAFLEEDPNAALLQKAILLELLLLLCREKRAGDLDSRTAVSHPLVLRIIEQINADLSADLSVDAIAARNFLSRSYLMNLFKKETGCTLGGYVTEKRLWLARSLLRQGVSINEACLRSGFANYANFYRAFKKRYGVSPREADRLPAETEH